MEKEVQSSSSNKSNKDFIITVIAILVLAVFASSIKYEVSGKAIWNKWLENFFGESKNQDSGIVMKQSYSGDEEQRSSDCEGYTCSCREGYVVSQNKCREKCSCGCKKIGTSGKRNLISGQCGIGGHYPGPEGPPPSP